MVTAPVVVLFFNRPASVGRLIESLAAVEPSKLYLVCDGPRQAKPGELDLVQECRSLFEHLTWACEVNKNYADVNLGCRARIISGLDWVFEQEEQAIIVEDDCIPIADFFPFCETMLERFRSDRRILSVGGTNLCPDKAWPEYSVTFSKYPMIWGWATWRRAWALMDRDLTLLPAAERNHLLRHILGSWRAEWYWRYLLKTVKTSWGYRWAFTSFVNSGLHVLPNRNLVDNIGMASADATHAKRNPYAMPATERAFPPPYRLPEFVCPNGALDRWTEDNCFSRSLASRVRWLIRKWTPAR
jgi:hypothetical protein